ncbi:hypothetical protein OXX59_007332 [Metschnikowia pulcherrima]
MSYTFSVTYQNIPRKVTCKPTASVNQLVSLSLEKFKLSPATNGYLSHNGKNLDGVVPIRLTGLVNNAKLTLSTSSGTYEATLKLTGVVDGVSVSKVLKVQSHVYLPALVTRFLSETGHNFALDTKLVELSIMRQAVRSSLPEFAQMTVGALVGSASNAVVRINVEDQAVALAKQENSRKIAAEAESRRKEQALQAESAKSSNIALSQNGVYNDTKSSESDPNTEIESTLKAPETTSANHAESAFGSEQPTHSSEPENLISMERPEKSASSGINHKHAAPEELEKSQKETENNETKQPESWTLPEVNEDTLYVPLKSTSGPYENPDADYELTSNQAEKYYKILKSMQGKPAKKVAKKPSKYTIRIRFPDRALLDLHFEDPATKLGQLLRKLDSYLLEKHINSYHLKNGLPPFEEIQFGFGANNTSLCDHPHFQQEKILLIWESQSVSAGPYLKQDLSRKDVSELPTVVLESHRGDLEADEESSKGIRSTADSRSADGKSKARAKGMPKWFRP